MFNITWSVQTWYCNSYNDLNL